jgi:hypothetical protein
VGSCLDSYIQLIGSSVPVIVTFTKFDVVVTLMGNKFKALALCEQSCHDLFHREPRIVPVEAVSGNCSLFLEVILLMLFLRSVHAMLRTYFQSSKDNR